MSRFDRDELGRFRPGHKVKSPGRKPLARETEYYNALSKVIDPDAIEQIAEKIKTFILAEGNLDPRLLKLLFDRLIPNMPKRIQIEDDRTWDNLAYLIEQLQVREIPIANFFQTLADGLNKTDDRPIH